MRPYIERAVVGGGGNASTDLRRSTQIRNPQISPNHGRPLSLIAFRGIICENLRYSVDVFLAGCRPGDRTKHARPQIGADSEPITTPGFSRRCLSLRTLPRSEPRQTPAGHVIPSPQPRKTRRDLVNGSASINQVRLVSSVKYELDDLTAGRDVARYVSTRFQRSLRFLRLPFSILDSHFSPPPASIARASR